MLLFVLGPFIEMNLKGKILSKDMVLELPELTLLELLGLGGFIFGLGGFILGIINLYLSWAKHRKDKPIITITKSAYKKHKKFEELSPEEYANKALNGEFNNGILNYEIRELVVEITNSGHRDAKLKKVLPSYEQERQNSFSPKVINFNPTTISMGDREPISLFFEFPIDVITRIEKSLPNIINVEFDFAHKKIKEKFLIGEDSFAKSK